MEVPSSAQLPSLWRLDVKHSQRKDLLTPSLRELPPFHSVYQAHLEKMVVYVSKN